MNTTLSTDLLTSSAVVSATKNLLNGLVVQADGTNVATVIIYDNATAASGKVIAKIVVPAGARTDSLLFTRAVQAGAGLYCSISGVGAAASVYYSAS